MNDGSVVIDALLSLDKFKGGVNTIKSDLQSIANAAERSGTDAAKRLGASMTAAGTNMTKFLTVPIAAAGAASVKVAATFESSMSQVAATMGLTADEAARGERGFNDLERAAIEMGSKTQFSASQAAEALNYLALAGYDSQKSIETLPIVLNLAAAGGMELASASDMVTDAMSALGLETDQAESFVDKMAVTAQKSNTSVSQLGEAVLTVGGTAKVLRGGVTELNAELGILADNGIKGAEGGTALRNIILSLTAPTDTAASTMKKLGLEVFDAEGNMRSLDDIFRDLNGTLSTMNDADRLEVLSTLFNKVDLKSANALLAGSGDRFAELAGYIDSSDGAAENMAKTMNSNLNGKLTQLSSAVEGAAIVIGNSLIPVIGAVTDTINFWVSAFNSLDPTMQTAIVVILGVVAAIGPLLMILGVVITTVSTVGPVVGAAGAAIAAFATGPVGLVIAAIAATIAILVALYQNCEGFRNFVNGLPQVFIDVVNAIAAKFQEFEGLVVSVFDAVSGAASSVAAFLAALFTDPFGTLRSAVLNIIRWVTNNFKLPEIKFPHIKLPHFNISGELSLNPPSVPSIGVDWYAKGGYMNGATILGLDGGRAVGAGEAGGEGIVPLEGKHMYPLADAIAERMGNEQVIELLVEIIQLLSEMGVYIDGDVLVGRIAKRMNRALQLESVRGAIWA